MDTVQSRLIQQAGVQGQLEGIAGIIRGRSETKAAIHTATKHVHADLYQESKEEQLHRIHLQYTG